MDKLIEDTSDGFCGEYSFLSNMYPVNLLYNGMVFKSSEHLYQWLKCKDCPHFSNRILEAPTGQKAKRITREKGFPDVAEEDKLEYMQIAIDLKFSIPEMKAMLLSTDGIELVEYNWWKDMFWGVCDGRGKNVLGNMLMRKREELKSYES